MKNLNRDLKKFIEEIRSNYQLGYDQIFNKLVDIYDVNGIIKRIKPITKEEVIKELKTQAEIASEDKKDTYYYDTVIQLYENNSIQVEQKKDFQIYDLVRFLKSMLDKLDKKYYYNRHIKSYFEIYEKLILTIFDEDLHINAQCMEEFENKYKLQDSKNVYKIDNLVKFLESMNIKLDGNGNIQAQFKLCEKLILTSPDESKEMCIEPLEIKKDEVNIVSLGDIRKFREELLTSLINFMGSNGHFELAVEYDKKHPYLYCQEFYINQLSKLNDFKHIRRYIEMELEESEKVIDDTYIDDLKSRLYAGFLSFSSSDIDFLKSKGIGFHYCYSRIDSITTYNDLRNIFSRMHDLFKNNDKEFIEWLKEKENAGEWLIKIYSNLSLDQLILLKSKISSFKERTYNEELIYNSKNILLKFCDVLIKKGLNNIYNVDICAIKQNLEKVTTSEEIEEFYSNYVQEGIFKKNKIPGFEDSEIPEEPFLYELIKKLDDTFLINLKGEENRLARYYLGVINRKYSRVIKGYSKIWGKNFAELDSVIDDILNFKLEKEGDELSKEKQDELLKNFFLGGKEWLEEFPSLKGKDLAKERELTLAKKDSDLVLEKVLFEPIRLTKNKIDFQLSEDIVKEMKFFKNVIIGAQNRMEIYKKHQIFVEGDYTWLVCCQIKLIERYLKLYIKQESLKIYRTSNGKVVRRRDGMLDILRAEENNVNIIDAEIGGIVTGLQYYFYEQNKVNPVSKMPWFLKGYFKQDNNKIVEFKPGSLNDPKSTHVTSLCPIHKGFTTGFRNGFFHVEPINTFKEAEIISKGVAYWLSCCINEFGKISNT